MFSLSPIILGSAILEYICSRKLSGCEISLNPTRFKPRLKLQTSDFGHEQSLRCKILRWLTKLFSKWNWCICYVIYDHGLNVVVGWETWLRKVVVKNLHVILIIVWMSLYMFILEMRVSECVNVCLYQSLEEIPITKYHVWLRLWPHKLSFGGFVIRSTIGTRHLKPNLLGHSLRNYKFWRWRLVVCYYKFDVVKDLTSQNLWMSKMKC